MHRRLTHTLLASSLALTACDAEPRPAATADTTGDTAADVAPDAADGASSPDTAAPALAFCEGQTAFLYDPVAGLDLTAFPDDFWTREADSLTGLRVDVDEHTPWLPAQPAFLQPIFAQLAFLDGFGTSAGVLLRFSAPLADVPSGEAASLATDAIALFAIDGERAERVPFEAQLLDGATTLVLWPMRPLAPKAHHAAIVTTAMRAADGGCIAPSPQLRALLDPATPPATLDPRAARLAPRLATAIAAAGLAPDEVSAAVVFTTQAVHDASLDAAADIATRSYTWSTPPTCSTLSSYRRCEGAFKALDYRHEGYLGEPVTPTSYTLPVHIWLPKTGDGPFPVILYGHGLSGDATQAQFVARGVAPLGFAVVAISTLRHGDHPTARPDVANAFFLDLLGIDMNAFTIDTMVFRENLRQAAFDKLQLLELLAAHPDVDGADGPDLDLDRAAYFGISLGGIMGANLLALGDRLDAAVLGLAGGRLISVITDGADFSQMKQILVGLIGDEAAIDRLAPVAQALIDAGDPVNYAPHVLRDRFLGAPPHLLQNLAMDDTVVPNTTSRALARAFGLTHVPPVALPIDLVPAEATVPVRGNREGGALTAGLFQFDRVTPREGAPPEAATHMNVFDSLEGPGQAFHFLETWASTGIPEISNPYRDFGTPALP